MEQLALFAPAGQSKGLLEYQPSLLRLAESDKLLAHFIQNTHWKQTTQKLWDKEYLTQRLTSW